MACLNIIPVKRTCPTLLRTDCYSSKIKNTYLLLLGDKEGVAVVAVVAVVEFGLSALVGHKV